MSTRIPIFVCLLFAGLILACSGGKTIKAPVQAEIAPAVPDPSLARQERIDNATYNHFINGSIFEAMGEYYAAAREYAAALELAPRSSQIRYSYANSLYMLKDFAGAVKQLDKIKEKDASEWGLLGDSYRALGVYDSSITAYLEAVKFDSTLLNAYYFIGAYYQQMDNVDSAIWGYQNVARLTDNYQAYQQLGNLQLKAGYIKEALKSYNESFHRDSTAINLRSVLGLSAIYEESGDRQKGKSFMEYAAELAPDDLMVLNRLFGFYQEDQQYVEAEKVGRRLATLAPDDIGIARRLGVIYFELDSLRLADSVFSDLFERGDSHIITYYYAGQTSFRQDNLPRARELFEYLTVSADSVIDGWMNLAMVYHKMDSLDIEIGTFEKGLKYMRSAPDSVVLMFSLGAALERAKEYDRAIVAFEEVLKIKPDHGQSLNYLGYMLAERGSRLDYARKLIEKALKIEPENGAFIDSYGWVLYQEGNYKRALEELLKAYQYINNDPIIMEHIGDTYRALGEHDNAFKFWQKALERAPENQKLKEKLSR